VKCRTTEVRNIAVLRHFVARLSSSEVPAFKLSAVKHIPTVHETPDSLFMI